MDFNVSGSDEWDSTPAQDNFIETYLLKQEQPLKKTSQDTLSVELTAKVKAEVLPKKKRKRNQSTEPTSEDKVKAELLPKKKKKTLSVEPTAIEEVKAELLLKKKRKKKLSAEPTTEEEVKEEELLMEKPKKKRKQTLSEKEEPTAEEEAEPLVKKPKKKRKNTLSVEPTEKEEMKAEPLVKKKKKKSLPLEPTAKDEVKEDILTTEIAKPNGIGTTLNQSFASMSECKSKALEQLQAGKFRFLNEKMYKETGQSAFQYFKQNTEEYEDYHIGFEKQVAKWPMNPVNKIIEDLKGSERCRVIADMGCGEARIAQLLTDRKVHSFDLVALNEFVTPCDFAKVPLSKSTVDAVVFCLSLMGTNLKDFLMEGHRILKRGGLLKIAEVESRISDLETFITFIECLGFTLLAQDTKHKLFVFLDFKKEQKKIRRKVHHFQLAPCLYKKR